MPDTPFLVVCSSVGHPPHGYIIDAPSAEVSAKTARYRYSAVTDAEVIDTQVTAYADLPEIMFGGE